MTRRWAGVIPVAGMLLLWSVGGAPARASEVAEPAHPDSALATILQAMAGTPLSISDAVSLSIQNATAVRYADAARQAAAGALRTEAGAFDPTLYFDYNSASTTQPPVSAFSGSSSVITDTRSGDAGASVTFPTGTRVDLSVVSARTNLSSAPYNSVNPSLTVTSALTVTQPLLKGLGPGTWGARNSARRLYEAAEAGFEDALLASRATAEETYWDLYAAERDYAVQQLNRDRSSAFLELTRTRARAGLASPGDVASAQSFLAEQDQLLLDLEENLESVSNRMGTLMGRRPESFGSRFHPTDGPPLDFKAPPEDSVTAWAMDRSRELRAARQAWEGARALAARARWNALPQLDVFGSLGGNGLAGTGQAVTIGDTTFPAPQVAPGFGDAFSQSRNRDYPNWSVGVRLSMSLFQRPDRGRRDLLAAQADEAEQNYIATRRSLEERVRLNYVALSRGATRLAAAKSGLEAAREQVRIGNLEYTAGRTTAFELVRLRADLASAERRYSQALVRAAKASAELGRYTTAVVTQP